MFGTLSILLLYANKAQYFEQKFRYAFWIIFTGVVLGALTEYLQSTLFVRRDGNWFDFIANILGTIFGVFVFILFYRKKTVK